MFMLTILISSPENFKTSFLAKIGDALNTSVSKLQAEYMLVKKQIAQQKEAKRKSQPGGNPPDEDLMALPKRLIKNIYYLLWICSAIFYEIEKIEMPNSETRLKEQLKDKYLTETFKVLKDVSQKKGILTADNDPRFLLLLSQKLDNINFVDSFNVLKKIIDKLENNPFLYLIDSDEFNRDLVFVPRNKSKIAKAQRTQKNAPVRRQSKTPAKKIKRQLNTTYTKKAAGNESHQKKAPALSKSPDIVPKYSYRHTVMEKRMHNFS